MNQFESIPIPESFSVTTGSDEERYILNKRDEFFLSVRKSLGLAAVRADGLFQVNEAVLLRSDSGQTDDVLHRLRWAGTDTTLASVLDERNSFNSHYVSFGVHKIDESVDSQITSYVNA